MSTEKENQPPSEQPNSNTPQGDPPPDNNWKHIAISWVLTMAMLIFYFSVANQSSTPEIPYSTFKNKIRSDSIAEIVIQGDTIHGLYTANEPTKNDQSHRFTTHIPPIADSELIPLLEEHHVTMKVKGRDQPLLLQVFISLIPWLLILALFFFSAKWTSKMGMGNPLNRFNRSNARKTQGEDIKIRFDDVAGLENTKIELREIIDFLKTPEQFQELGAHIPKGVLMMGPPGTGKTMLAKATAGEAGVPFFSITGSEFVEMFVGVGASRVRDMFKSAREASPSLIFIDEIDAVGRVRGTGLGGGNDEREQTLNQILAEMDGFSDKETVVVLAATNRPDVLDPALLRPGRFDRKVALDLPQKKARLEILKVHVRNVPLAEDVNLEHIAASTVGFAGADLANLVNEAALQAARKKLHKVDKLSFELARDKIILGTEREELQNPEEQRRIACHESGHALAAWYLPHADHLRRVTIIPHGRALGVTEQNPDEDKFNYGQHYLEDRISIMLGGRCAEQLIFSEVSSGAADDLNKATQLARKMISSWGMNEGLGPVSFPQSEEHPFLGREMALPKSFSEHTAEMIDEEVVNLIKKCEKKTIDLLSDHKTELLKLMDSLLEHETLDEDALMAILQSRPNRAEG